MIKVWWWSVEYVAKKQCIYSTVNLNGSGREFQGRGNRTCLMKQNNKFKNQRLFYYTWHVNCFIPAILVLPTQ